MRIVRVAEFGEPDVLRTVEVADPVPGAGQVVVAVVAADVLYLDTMIRRGAATAFFPVRPPYVPGTGVSGTVTAAGEGVPDSWLGRRVVVETDGGGYASQVTASVEDLIAVPDDVDLPVAAALLHDGRTAYGLLETTPVRAGDRVLVTAAGGGLGLMLVQLARAAGAHVVAAARGDTKLAAARAAGAGETVDYSIPRWTDAVGAVDVLYDGAGGDIASASARLVPAGGRISAHGAPGGFPDLTEARARGVTVLGIEQVRFGRSEIRRLVSAALAGPARPVIGATYLLDRAARAHAAIERRAVVGKALLIAHS